MEQAGAMRHAWALRAGRWAGACALWLAAGSAQAIDGWELTAAANLDYTEALLVHDSGALYAGTSAGGVSKSMDGGSSWMPVHTGLGSVGFNGILSLAMDGFGKLYAGTDGAGVYTSSNGGASWTAATGLNAAYVNALAAGSGSQMYAGTSEGVYFSPDGGSRWVAITTGLPTDGVSNLLINGNGQVYAATHGNGVYRLYDDGSFVQWVAANGGLATSDVRALAMDSAGALYAGTAGGGIYKSVNGGTQWTAVNVGLTNLQVHTLVVDGTGTLYAGTNGGGVFRSSNGGARWQAINVGLTRLNVPALAVDAAGRVYAGTGGSGVFRSFVNVYSVSQGSIAPADVTVAETGPLGRRTVTVELRMVQPGAQAAMLGRRTFAREANYQVFVVAVVPGQVLAQPIPMVVLKTEDGLWGPVTSPAGPFIRNVAVGSQDNRVLIELAKDNDLSGLIGTEFYIGYGITDEEMLMAQRYRGVYKIK